MKNGRMIWQALLCFVLVFSLTLPAGVAGASSATAQATDEHVVVDLKMASSSLDSTICIADDYATTRAAVEAATPGDTVIVRNASTREVTTQDLCPHEPGPEAGFDSIADELVIAYHYAGLGVWHVYWPEFAIDTIEALEVGKIYIIYVDSDCALEYGSENYPLSGPDWNFIYWLGCSSEEEDPKDRFVEILQPTNEQLEQLETGTATLQLREDQVDILSDYVTQLVDDLQPWLDEGQWQEVKELLEAMLTQGEVDLQALGPVAEAMHDSLVSEAEAGIGVYTNLVRLPTESTATTEDQTQLADGSQRSTCVTVYTPRDSISGDKHYERKYGSSELAHGKGSESDAFVDPYGGAIAVYSYTDPWGAASAYALQRIRINVPVDASDITITSKLLYTSGTFSLFPLPFSGGATSIVTVQPYQLHQEGEISEQVIDSWFDWYDAAKLALLILTAAVSGPVAIVGAGVGALATGYDAVAYRYALQAYGEEETITYNAGSLPAGDYIFEIGVCAEALATFGVAKAFVFGMVPEIKVTMNIPSLTLDITSTDGGYVAAPGEGIFPYCPEEEVNIVAISYQGYRFTGWTGDVDTIDRVDSQSTFITMDGDYSITANFEAVQYDLTISSTTGGSVSTPGEGTFPCDASTTVNLVARPDSGYRFVEWTGDVDWIEDVNALSTKILMLDDYSIRANFEVIPPAQYTLIMAVQGYGNTSPKVGQHTYTAGTPVPIVATEAEGWQFVNWTGDVGTIADINDATTTITMNGDYSITANFEEEEQVCATVLPTTAQYDLANPDDVTTTITWNDATSMASIHDGSAYLTPGVDFTVAGNTLTILNTYLAGELTTVGDSVVLTITFDICTPVTFTITANSMEEDAVYFPDPNLEAVIRLAIGKPAGEIYPSDLEWLTFLDADQRHITDITGLEYATGLTSLHLFDNQISDIGALTNLTSLYKLVLKNNDISNIQPLANLIGLEELWLMSNEITDIQVLANLTNLTVLDLAYNPISNIQALANLTSLEHLRLGGLQISDISALANLTSLYWLNLRNNQINNIQALANLTGLYRLELEDNRISDIQALANLTGLHRLELQNNQVSDIQVLANLGNLYWIKLENNQISDISALVDNPELAEGDYIFLNDNPLNEDSINIYIPQLTARGANVYY